MEKMFLACEGCGYVQAVGAGRTIWGCASCKRQQAVDKRMQRSENGRGRRMQTCAECGHAQSVRVNRRVWTCYECRRPQLQVLEQAEEGE